MGDFSENVLWELREIARQEPNQALRVVAKTTADRLDRSIREFARQPIQEHLQTVNGLWAIGQRIIDVWNEPHPSPPQAGAGANTVIECSVKPHFTDYIEMAKAA